jgi:hypothetical protein
LNGGARLRTEFAKGANLTTFLRIAVDEARGPVDIVVAGHSKGGALAPTVALWLAETRGTRDVAPHEQWDPDGRAEVRCFAFAGPTAGNRAFAAHSDATIGARTHRIWNPLDLVPRAWVPADLEAIIGLYGADVRRSALVEALVNEIARQIADEDYAHPGNHVIRLETAVDPQRREFFDQVIYQHLEGYLVGMELDGLVNAATFFSPLR